MILRTEILAKNFIFYKYNKILSWSSLFLQSLPSIAR